MEDLDVRWKQRFENYSKALDKLDEACRIVTTQLNYGMDITELLQEGLIQRFEYTHELAWNVLKDYAGYQGYTEIRGSRDAFRWALQNSIIADKAWIKSIEDRNLSSHDYDKATAEALVTKIIGTYLPLFIQLGQKMKSLLSEE